MPPPETTARRASRIKDRFYFHKWNRFERWKWGLSIVLLTAALLAAFAGVTLPTRGTRFYTHGPVAANCGLRLSRLLLSRGSASNRRTSS